MEDILIPLGVCVLMPVLIVWLTARARQNKTNRQAEVMIKAIEAGQQLDPDFFKSTAATKTIKEKLLGRLTGALVVGLLGVAALVTGILTCASVGWSMKDSPAPLAVYAGALLLAIGVALFVVYLTGKKMMAKEIAAEEEEMTRRQ